MAHKGRKRIGITGSLANMFHNIIKEFVDPVADSF